MSQEAYPILMYAILPDTPTENISRLLAQETAAIMRRYGDPEKQHVDVEWIPKAVEWETEAVGYYRLELRWNDDPRRR